jgi:hypothetical protein
MHGALVHTRRCVVVESHGGTVETARLRDGGSRAPELGRETERRSLRGRDAVRVAIREADDAVILLGVMLLQSDGSAAIPMYGGILLVDD